MAKKIIDRRMENRQEVQDAGTGTGTGEVVAGTLRSHDIGKLVGDKGGSR